jgi:hypothetical protein
MTVRTGQGYGPVLHWLGTSNVQFAGLQLPFDLTSVGAPGNHLLASMEVITTVTLRQAGSSWSAHHTWDIPNSPALRGSTLFAQWALNDPPSNAMGWVFTDALEVLIAPGAARPVEHNLLYATDSSYPIGWFPMQTTAQGPGAGGPVVELQGAFQ